VINWGEPAGRAAFCYRKQILAGSWKIFSRRLIFPLSCPGTGFFDPGLFVVQVLMLSQESKKSEWLSKKRQMQGAQLSRNEAYYDYAAVTRAIAATQQLVSFCDAIKFLDQFRKNR
jgi:hypothetical protein